MKDKIDQREYLKKYLSGDKPRQKKKKKSSNSDKQRVKIIDDDIDFTGNETNNIDEIILTGEDAPQIVGVIDDRPPELRAAEDFRNSGKWKSITQNEIQKQLIEKSKMKLNNINTRKQDSVEDISPVRKRNNRSGSKDLSPVRKKTIKDHHEFDDDLSPRRKRTVHREKSKSFSPGLHSKKQKLHDDDLSPRRKSEKDRDKYKHGSEKRYDNEDLSLKRNNKHHSRSRDITPRNNRRYKQASSSKDLSPKRNKYRSRSRSITSRNNRRYKQASSSKDLSPKRNKYRSRSRSITPRNNRRYKQASSSKDLSPKRNKYRRSRSITPRNNRRYKQASSSKDLSPTRNKYRSRSQSITPRNNRRYKQASSSKDLSPKRNKYRSGSQSVAPKNSKKYKQTSSNEDLSPKRNKYRSRSRSVTPKNTKKYKQTSSNEGLSPRRSNKYHSRSRSVTPKNTKKYKQTSSNEGLSPRRSNKYHSRSRSVTPKNNRRNKHTSSSKDLSPKRKHNIKYDIKYTNKKSESFHKELITKHNKDVNLKHSGKDNDKSMGQKENYKNDRCSAQKVKDNRSDLNPKRINRSLSSSPTARQSTSLEVKRKTLGGKTAGLQDAKTLKLESEEIRQKERELFSKMSTEITGKNAEIRVRATGSKYKHDRNLNKELEDEQRKTKLEKEKKEIYSRWGKGLKQIEDYTNKISEEQHEMNKPLARYADDEDLDKILRKQERAGDPMLEYIRRKEKGKNPKTNQLSIPIYQGNFPENRFNIRPGYRWDGVDRSNGYERRWFEMQSKKKAIQEEAYRYNTEDM